MAEEEGKKRIKSLIQAMKKERGYLPQEWEYAAEKDVDFMNAYNNFYDLGLKAGKVLPIKTRELIVIALLAYRGKEEGVYHHIKKHPQYRAGLLHSVQGSRL